MQVTVQNENTVVVDVQQQETIVVEVDQGRAGRGIQNITYTEVSGQYFLIVTYTDGTTETLGPLVVTGGAAFLLGGATGSIPYQSAPNTTVFLPIGTQNQVVVAGATAPQYTSALTGLTVNNSAIGNTAPSTGAFTNLSASGTFALTGDQVQISEGGTGQTTANGAFNALAPSQTGNAGKYLKTDGTNSSWDQLDISTADITGTLPIANGGTGQTTANSALNALLPTQAAQSGKYLKTDGTNASWDQLDISTADITGVLPIANGGTGASTAAGARANLSAAILGTNNDITSLTGITGGISTPDFVQFDTTATEANAVGKVYWDAAQGTLDLGLLGGNVVSRIGQSLVAYVTNAEAVTITKGQAVYLFSAQGNRASVKLASNLSDATSAKTFGVVAENIPANGTGFVMCQGVLEGLNLGAYTAGDTLYLGATPGSLTATKPYAPNHLVYVGLVERANAGNGQLYVKVQNGYELDEIHDVQIINPQNGQTILYDASTSLWKNANLTAGTGISVTNGAASVTIGNTGVLSFSGGTTGLTPATSTTGAVTLGGTLAVASGGTGATTAGGALTNLGAASSTITISAGTGLTGGGDLTANRTLSIANTTVTAASYGSASSVGTFTVNAQGQLTAAASTPIAIANTQVSGLGTMSTQNSNSVTITGGSITGITDLAIADGGTGASDAPTARTNLGLGTSATLNAGVALGVATLDAGGTVPLSQLPASIQGGVSYQGSWDAATNTPTIVSSVGTKGYYYVVSVAGSTNINGISDWLPGDWIIFNGSIWQKIDNTDAVASVNGYTGVVVLNAADVGAAPTSRTITAGTGLTGGGDLSANRTISIANTTVAAGSYGSASSVGTFTVNGQGQLTAAASTPIAITNTQVSGLGTMSTQNAGSVAITGGTIDGTTIGGTTRAAGSFTTLTLTNALSVANGGTGTTTSTGTGSVVLSSSPTLTTPNLGTPSAATLTNATGLPLTTGVTGTLPIGNGGTGQTTANAAFNALAPSQTGNAGKYLTTDGTNTSWATNPLGTVTSVDVSGGTTGLTTSGGPITSSGTITLGGTLGVANGGTGTTTAFTAGSVVFAGASGVYSQNNSQLFWDNTNTRLGIGTATPTQRFHVEGGNARINNGSNSTILFLGGSPSANWEGDIQFVTSNNQINWRLASNRVSAGAFTITPSTAVGGSSFTTPALTIDSASNVGIGTSSPAYKLDVVGEVRANNLFRTTDGTNIGLFGSSVFAGGVVGIGSSNSVPLVFGTGATERGRFSSDGTFRVKGSGTAGSTDAVQFAGTAPASSLILDSSGSLGVGETSPGSYSKFVVQNSSAALAFFYRTSSAGLSIGADNDGPYLTTNTYHNLRFFTNATERGRFSSDGTFRVKGVGTAGSSDAIQFSGSAPGYSLIVDSTGSAALSATSVSRVNSDTTLYIQGSAFASLNLGCGGAYAGAGLTVNSSAQLLIRNGGATVGTFTQSGLFTVGTATNTNSSTIVSGGTISETVSGTQYLVASQFDIGTAPNKIPLNQYLGNLAYQNASSIAGQVGLSAGTQALPSLVSATDTATGWWFPAASQLAASVGGVEGIRLTSTGLGIGTSSPNFPASRNGLVVRANSSNGAEIILQSTNATAGSNTGFATAVTGNDVYFVNRLDGFLSWITGSGGNTERMRISADGTFRVKGAGTAGSTDAVQFAGSAPASALTLDASGNLLVGTTTANGAKFAVNAVPNNVIGSQAAFIAGTKTKYASVDQLPQGQLFVYDNAGTSAGTGGAISFGGDAGSGQQTWYAAIEARKDNSTVGDYGGAMVFYTRPSGATAGERARITSGGGLWVGNTTRQSTSNHSFIQITENDWTANFQCNTATAANNLGVLVYYKGSSPNGTGNPFLRCDDSTTTRAEIRSNGGLANYSGNNVNLSDRREKTNFAPAKSYLDTICAIPVQTFNYIDQSEDDPGLTLGVVAQDVQAVAPELVMESNWGTKDDPKMRLSIYQTDLQYALMKCIQELKAQNDELRQRVAALEAK